MKRRLFWSAAPVAAAILILAAGCAESPTAPGMDAAVEASFNKGNDKANDGDKGLVPTDPTDPTGGDDGTVRTTGAGAVAVG